MDTKVKTDRRDYHIRLSEELNERLPKYLEAEFRPNSRVVTAIFEKALDSFLKDKGY